MAPIDWEQLMKIDPDGIDDDETDDMYNALLEFEVGDEAAADRLKQLFEVTKNIMERKNMQAEVAEGELEEISSKEGRSFAKKDQEMEDLRREIDTLKREKKDYERFGGEGTKALSGKDESRYLRDEVINLESQVDKKETEIHDLEAQLRQKQQASDEYMELKEKAEKENRDLRRDNEQLREDIRDYQRQLDSQRETMLAKRDEDKDYRDKMTQHNKLLVGALEENRNLAENNVELEVKVEEMKKEMREGQEEIERTTDEYLKLKMVVSKTDSIQDGLRRENDMLKDQINDLMEQVKSRGDMDNDIMSKVNDKVEEWKGLLADKDMRIQDLQEQIFGLRDQLVAANMDSEKTSVAALTKALEERDKQIAALRRRLEEAVEDMDDDADMMDDVRNEMMKSGKGDRHMMKISQLQDTLKYHESQLKDAESRAIEAENDARVKDKEMNEALEKIRAMESGVFGLPEAVNEIKELKQFITTRDREIEELTQYINKCEEKVNDLYDETDDLRERLGLDPKEPLDLTEFKKKKGIRMQEDRALNRVLQKEIEQLEEERIVMKTQIRKLAQAGGTRAVALGLDADDMGRIEEYIEDLKEKKKLAKTAKTIKKDVEEEVFKARAVQLGAEVGVKERKLDQINRENVDLTTKVKELEKENKTLEKGMKEIHEAIKEQADAGGQAHNIECPTLERMLAAIEMRNLTGGYDTSLYLKAQVDNLTGHNQELRTELREVRFESTRAQVGLEKAKSKVEVLESEVTSLKEAGGSGFYQTVHLPEGMAVASSDVIASLNERLVQVLQEVSIKEDTLVKMEEGLDSYRRKFAVVRHQQGLVYQDYLKEKKEWEAGKDALEKQITQLQGRCEDGQVHIEEYNRLLDTLDQDEPEVRRRLAESTRKVTKLRVNERALTRRFNAIQEIEGYLRKDNTKFRNDMIQMEAAVSDRLGYLQRHKELTTFKVATLQRMLDDSVPEAEVTTINKKFTDLTEKYRDALESSNTMLSNQEKESGYEIEVKRLQDENNYLQRELSIEKEKLHTLEAAFEKMKTSGMATSQTLRDSDLMSISKKLTTLEMKELNERQRADHASRMYDLQKKQLRDLEDRNFDLEQKFADLTRMNIAQQKVERELRDELATCITKAVSDNDRRKIATLEKSETTLRVETSKLKDIAEVASAQVRAMESQNTSRDKEVTSLRQQLLDFQAQSDEKTIIGKLHRHIVQLQISEGMALRRLEDATKKVFKLDALVLRTEQRIDDKDQTIYHNRLESRSKAMYLKHTIQDLRSKYAGAVPLQEQEKFSKMMTKVTEERNKVADDYRKTNEERHNVEDKLQELSLQHKGLQDLMVTLKDGKGAQKVAEWHAKMEQVRLEDLRLKREIDRHKQQLKFQENMLKKHESEVILLDEEKVRLSREFETRELEWEHREVELERIIANMERQQAEIAGAATQFEDAVGALPDPSLPVSEQLEIAVTTIKNNVKLVLDSKAESAFAKKKIEELELELKDNKKAVLSRDRIINELRLRLPASAERDQAIAKATAAATGSAPPGDEGTDYESKQAVRVAQSTVHHLQARIHQKEETVHKYQELLRQARDDMAASNKRNEEEIRLMQDKVNNRSDAAFHKFKQTVQDSLEVKAGNKVPTNEQLKRLNELEDIVADQDNSIAALRDKLNKSRQEIQDWRYKYEDAVRQNAQEKEGMVGGHSEEVQQLKNYIENMKQQLSDKHKEYDILLEELEVQKEANSRAPAATMKKLVERLRNELALKEKQHQALSKALMDLRGEMVLQAQEDVKAHANQNTLELNVQKLVDKESKELKVRIEELDGQVTKLRKEKKKSRETETTITTELDETKQELAQKEGQLRKARSDRSRLESEVQELERKVERMNTMGKQAAGTTGIATSENLRAELDELRRKNRLLQDEAKRTKHQAEKPYEQQAKEGSAELQVAKWEENKKWQKLTDRLKVRIKDKEGELEKLYKSNDMLKSGLDRANKDKEIMESKLRAANKPPIERTIVREVSSAPPESMKPKQVHNLEELRKINYDLEEQNATLRRQLTHGRDAAFKEVQMRNKFLTDKLDHMERQMQHRSMSASQDGTSVGQTTYRDLAKKESALQKDLIKMSEENIELRFELEQSKKDLPRMKGRIEDLEKYVEILKEEKRQMEIMRSSSRSLDSLGSLGSSLSGNYRRIGESGKTTKELEKTIALLKKVIEKTQSENKELRQAPGVVSNEQLKMLQGENQGLKGQLEELRKRMGASLSDRYVSQQKGTAKVMADHDKIRRDLMKSQEENEQVRIQLKEKDLTIEKLNRELTKSKGKLEYLEAKNPSLSTMNSKEWSAVVVPKMNEERMRALENEVEKKTQLLSDMKVLLREAAEKEHHLQQEKIELEQKVEILERYPPGSKAKDSDVVRQYQQSRLKIDRLENEKKELVNEIKLMKKHPSSVGEDDIVKGIVSHNKMLTENVEIRTQLKSSEIERDKLQHECVRLAKELENFGPDFFEEIEDLKYNYRESVQKNVQYEEQLTKLSRQFGVTVDIPGV